MDKQTSLPLPCCALHPSQVISKIDSRPDAAKDCYCVDCILEDQNPKALSEYLTTIEQFLNNVSTFYEAQRNQHQFSSLSDPPSEYVELISNKAEKLEQLTKSIENQKKSVENIFEEISQVVLQQITLAKNQYLQRLNNFIVDACDQYQQFEKEVKKNFSRNEDIEYLLPSKKELQNRLITVENFSELSSFIQGIKKDLKETASQNLCEMDLEAKKTYLSTLAQSLEEATSEKPRIEVKPLSFNNFASLFEEDLKGFLGKSFEFKKIEPFNNFVKPNSDYGSKILKPVEFYQLRKWLPEKYQAPPTLIYQSSRHGASADHFHSKCDKKGPTITIIECQFNGSSKRSIIGGFLDKSWHSNGQYIDSKEAFIFSLTKNLKFNSKDSHAAFGGNGYGPTFGGNNIRIGRDFKDCYVMPSYPSYQNDGTGIVDSELKDFKIAFTPFQVEVYSLS